MQVWAIRLPIETVFEHSHDHADDHFSKLELGEQLDVTFFFRDPYL